MAKQERAAPDRGQSDDEAPDKTDADRDDPIPRRQPTGLAAGPLRWKSALATNAADPNSRV